MIVPRSIAPKVLGNCSKAVAEVRSRSSGEFDSPIHYIDGARPITVESAEPIGPPGRVDGENLGP